MRRHAIAAGIALLGLAGGVAGVTDFAQADNATRPQTAYWSTAATGANSPAPPEVPDGGLYVGSVPSGPTAVSALRLHMSTASPDVTLTLHVAAIHIADSMTLDLFPATTAWQPGGNQPFGTRPGFDQQLPPIPGTMSADQTTVSFDLGAAVADQSWNLTLVPLPVPEFDTGTELPTEAGKTFTVAFKPVSAADLHTSAG